MRIQCLLKYLLFSKQATSLNPLLGNSFGAPFQNASYDYVVIGGAGLALAYRLSENPSISVAVIEAGGFYEHDNGNGSVIAGLAGGQALGTTTDITQPLIDWEFLTAPQAGHWSYCQYCRERLHT